MTGRHASSRGRRSLAAFGEGVWAWRDGGGKLCVGALAETPESSRALAGVVTHVAASGTHVVAVVAGFGLRCFDAATLTEQGTIEFGDENWEATAACGSPLPPCLSWEAEAGLLGAVAVAGSGAVAVIEISDDCAPKAGPGVRRLRGGISPREKAARFRLETCSPPSRRRLETSSPPSRRNAPRAASSPDKRPASPSQVVLRPTGAATLRATCGALADGGDWLACGDGGELRVLAWNVVREAGGVNDPEAFDTELYDLTEVAAAPSPSGAAIACLAARGTKIAVGYGLHAVAVYALADGALTLIAMELARSRAPRCVAWLGGGADARLVVGEAAGAAVLALTPTLKRVLRRAPEPPAAEVKEEDSEKPPPASDLVRVLVEDGVVETATEVCAVVDLGDDVAVVGESGEVATVA